MDPDSLLACARAGDQKAWNDLLVWCRPFVRAQLKRALPAWPDEASELTNDVQMRMHRGFPKFRGEAVCQFVAWARVIAKNVLCDFLDGHPPTLVPLPAEPPSPESEAWDQLDRAEDRVQRARALEKLPEHYRKVLEARLFDRLRAEDLVRLAGALEKLDENYRTVIEARLFDRLAPHEIAERLGWPQVRVRVYCWRAVQFLARQLREKS
jgi:RNA polymerase sigma factor (sigma-70 family)